MNLYFIIIIYKYIIMSLNGFTKDNILDLYIQGELSVNGPNGMDIDTNMDGTVWNIKESEITGDLQYFYNNINVFTIQTDGTVVATINTDTIMDGDNTTSITTNTPAETIVMTTNSTERMRINSSGNVGIGTNNPTSKLQVSGDTIISGDLTVNSNTLTVDSVNNRVGVGHPTTPDEKFNIYNGNFQMDFSNAFTNFRIDSITDSSVLKFTVANADTDSGNDKEWLRVDKWNGGGGRKLANNIRFFNWDLATATTQTEVLTMKEGLVGIKATIPMIDLAIGDNDTGFNNEGGNLLGLYTGGIERMRFDGSGNVGIGTSTPTQALHIERDSQSITNPGLLVKSVADNTQDSAIEIRGARNANTTGKQAQLVLSNFDDDLGTVGYLGQISGAVRNSTTNVGDMTFSTSVNGTSGSMVENMVITSTGNVGIGTSTPTEKLEVNGNTLITDSLTVGASGIAGSDLNVIGDLRVEHHTNAVAKIDATGTDIVNINVDTANASSYRSFQFQKGLFNSNSTDLLWNVGGQGFNTEEFHISNVNNNIAADRYTKLGYTGDISTAGLSIRKGGNVGIGTTTPTEALDIVGNLQVSGTISGTIQTDTIQDIDATTSITTADIAETIIMTTNSTERMRISSSGNVGIGKTPTAKLDVSGNILASGWVRGLASGQLLNTVALHNPTLTNTVINSGTFTTVLTRNYQPNSVVSKIIVEFDCNYIVGGSAGDTFESRLTIDGDIRQVKTQDWSNASGAGTRSAVLFPIKGVNDNTVPVPINILVEARRTVGDDTMTISGDCFLMIQEIQA